MKSFKRSLRTKNAQIEYIHEIKNVKNINIRITPEKGLCVSGPPDVNIETIEKFLLSKLDKIIPALDKMSSSKNSGLAAARPVGGKKNTIIGGKSIEYDLTFKKIKNMIVSVHITKGIRVSAPLHATQMDIDRFLHKNEDFIIQNLKKQAAAAENKPKEKKFITGEYIFFVGEKYLLEVYKSAKNYIELNDNSMIMYVTDTNDYTLKKTVFENFIKNECTDYVSSLCRQLYPRFKKKAIAFPNEIKFRKMISCWGNCRSRQKILTFSTYLIQLPPKCIETVVCHEFTHFLHQNHSKEFYSQLTEFMPDWKVHNKVMKTLQNEIIFK